MGIEKLKSGKYKVVASIRGNVIYLGCFDTHERATEVYTKAKDSLPKHKRIDAKFTNEECIEILQSKLRVWQLCIKHKVHYSTIYRARHRAKELIKYEKTKQPIRNNQSSDKAQLER
jgi:hypothetical protein